MPNPGKVLLPASAVLAPRGTLSLMDEQLRHDRRNVKAPWDPARHTVLAMLSANLLRHESLRRDPAAVALGFWLRPASLKELERTFPVEPGCWRVPAGLVLHITPANVDTMFVYSWALSFLAGNANIVRLTSRPSRLMQQLIALLVEVFALHPEPTAGNYFVSYGHDDDITAALSMMCDLRIVWGGDETVRRLRGVPLNPHAAERSFASKRSLSVIKSAAYGALASEPRQRLAEHMASDLTPFSQMACSSPHQLFWFGPAEESFECMADFSRRLDLAMGAKSEAADLGDSVRRLNAAFKAAANGQAMQVMLGGFSAALIAAAPEKSEQAEPCGAGFLFHAHFASLAQLAALLRSDHQTITYYGMGDDERLEMIKTAGAAGCDRVVPIGRALEFTPIWDGYSLWTDLTRGVAVR